VAVAVHQGRQVLVHQQLELLVEVLVVRLYILLEAGAVVQVDLMEQVRMVEARMVPQDMEVLVVVLVLAELMAG
jgi:hypothetical protein